MDIEAITVENLKIGPSRPVFIIAEAGVNHNGDIGLGKGLIDIAAEAGADAVKFQTFKADRVVSLMAPKAEYQIQTTNPMESQLEMLKHLELSQEAHWELKSHCQQRNLLFISSPFDEQGADFLEQLGVPLFKIGSGEITNWPFLEYVARKGKPIILSTGMCYLSEVDEAVRVIEGAGCDQLVLLHCTSSYPADPAEANLRAIQAMAAAFHLPVGYSDHTLGIEVALAAVALGACVIEKHFTLDRNLPGPDHRASLQPDELKALVRGLRTVEAALGHGHKEPAASEANTIPVARRSIVASRDIPAGTTLTEELIVIRRPGNGLSPKMIRQLLGAITQVDLKAGQPIGLEHLFRRPGP
jgi:N-acetylneuraminate synthase/N,N'-diacetyllegionaminate synthase